MQREIKLMPPMYDGMKTHMGVFWCHPEPKSDDVKIEDIAHALSLICRFAGHVNKFYSVGEHCIRVSDALPPELKLWGLLHDASECYCVDLPRPLKYSPGMEVYKHYENLTQNAICRRYGLSPMEPPEVKQIDTRMLMTEQRDLLGTKIRVWKNLIGPFPDMIKPWTPRVTEARYLKLFRKLYKGD